MDSPELLGDRGPLAQRLPGYEHRASQLEMARLVDRALEHEGVALIEAGTGTGKTLAYLVPALRSGRKVVISTGTRTLQDQIMAHDLPLLAAHLGWPIRAACVKGLANYVCRRRYAELLASPDSFAPAIARRLPMFGEWLERTELADRAELTDLAEDDPFWAAVQSGSDTRIGPRCRYYEDCFVTKVRRRAEEAQLVVVNHHLYFADLAMRAGGASVLPDYDAVIFDEAHQIEDVATLFFGVQVSEAQIERFVRDADRAFLAASPSSIDRPLRNVLNESEQFFACLPSGPENARLELPRQLFANASYAERYHRLDAALETVELACMRDGSSDAIGQLARRAKQLRDALNHVAEGSAGGGHVTWTDQRGRGRMVGASPIDVSAIFREHVVQRVPSVVLTSATLTTGGSFDFVKQRLGIDSEVDEAILASPFDYPRQAALYLPALPDPRAPAFLDEAAKEIAALIALTGGGAFVLCTSVRAMRGLADRFRTTNVEKRPLLVQGEAPKNALLTRFREAGDAVLFATASFWEGVDVPGEALRLVIVDKLPFDVPTDPLVVARCRRLEEDGQAPFMRYLVPSAALALKQAFGRLIRTRHDRGIVAILDSRLRTKGYGKVFLRSLPDAERCDSLDAVRAFWTDRSQSG